MEMSKRIIFSVTMLLVFSLIPALALAAPSSPASPSASSSASASASPSDSASASDKDDTFTVLKLASTGPYVVMLQMRLRDLGYFSYRATGSYGSITRTSVLKFQEDNDLAIDGTVGENTFNKLFYKNLPRAKLPATVKVVSALRTIPKRPKNTARPRTGLRLPPPSRWAPPPR